LRGKEKQNIELKQNKTIGLKNKIPGIFSKNIMYLQEK